MPDGTTIPIDETIAHEQATSPELLKIDPESWRKYEFSKFSSDGDFCSVLSGDVRPGDFMGGKIGGGLESIFTQLRKQNVECKTAIACTPSRELLLQVNPSIGSDESVNNIFAQPPEGTKILEVHNHPLKNDEFGGTFKTYGFFSSVDLSSFAYQDQDKVAEVVVFDEGTAILLKTDESRKIVQAMKDATKLGRWAWTHLSNMLSERMIKEVPNETNEERLNFSKAFAVSHKMKLLYVPAGQQDIKILA